MNIDNKKTNIRKNIILSFLFMIVMFVIAVVGMVAIVFIFEKHNIHIPGSREMWVGYVGSVLGGVFTLGGVILTINYQREYSNEEKRIENMPVLNFETINGQLVGTHDKTITISSKGITTCYNYNDTNKNDKCCKVVVTLENTKKVRDFTLTNIAVNGTDIKKCEDYKYNMGYMILNNKNGFSFEFDFVQPLSGILFVLMRFEYKDAFGNQYYQDVPMNIVGIIERNHKEIRGNVCYLKEPIFVKGRKIKSIEKTNKDYKDYLGLFLDDGFRFGEEE